MNSYSSKHVEEKLWEQLKKEKCILLVFIKQVHGVVLYLASFKCALFARVLTETCVRRSEDSRHWHTVLRYVLFACQLSELSWIFLVKLTVVSSPFLVVTRWIHFDTHTPCFIKTHFNIIPAVRLYLRSVIAQSVATRYWVARSGDRIPVGARFSTPV
jgi:hypothetical protein